MKQRVFVYGSLMKGFGNHQMLKGAKPIAKTKTKDDYTMVSLYAFPAALKKPYKKYGITGKIVGEVYEVSETTLRDLDILESNGRMYKREKVQVAGVITPVWMYFLMRPGSMKFEDDNFGIVKKGDSVVWVGPKNA